MNQPSGEMRWSALVSKLMLLQQRLDRKEIQVSQYSEEYRELMKLLADEIRSNPYANERK